LGGDAWQVGALDRWRRLPPPTPGVPESATWAMMMLGFVGLGAVADRKRAAFKAA
jgi:hypothetical protein